MPSRDRKRLFEICLSPIHGHGAFSTQQIEKGTLIAEYIGERITHKEANRRYNNELIKLIEKGTRVIENLGEAITRKEFRGRYDEETNVHAHVLLFTVNEQIVIDGGIEENDARFFNHSCEPNCRAIIKSERVYIEALQTIPAGEELTFDYNLKRLEEYDPERYKLYACNCGAQTCRGTLLAPLP